MTPHDRWGQVAWLGEGVKVEGYAPNNTKSSTL
jgi:hypothetical protein